MDTFIEHKTMEIGSVEANLTIEVMQYEQLGEAWGSQFYHQCTDVELVCVEVGDKDITKSLNPEWYNRAIERMCEA